LGVWRWPALATCTIVLSLGLLVPIASLTGWARRGIADGRVSFSELIDPTVSTASVAVVTAVIAVLVVLPVATAVTRRPHPLSNLASGAIVGGFAMPGLVIALALAVFALNTPVLGFLYQTLPLLIIAYVVHFGSQALTSTEQAARAVPTQLREQSRLLQPNPIRRLWSVDWPIMRPGLLAGGGLVILATVKELPATLLLAPIGFSTLATEVWGSYEEGFYAATGLSSLVLVAVSATLTWLLVLRRSNV
jgi:iron(III) transport system permease protein